MPPLPRVNLAETSPQLVTGRTTMTPWYVVPGIASGAAYASGDAMGLQFRIDMGSTSGMIVGALVHDADKEQLAFDICLFDSAIQGVADNVAFALLDPERFRVCGHISVGSADYCAFSTEAIATTRLAPPLAYVCPNRTMVAQLVTRGVPNYTAASDLAIRLLLLPDLG